jgi:hypothetical protein
MQKAILDACKAISVTFPRDADGRIVSAVKEIEYLEKLGYALPSAFQFKISKARHWNDFTCNGVPFNLKLTNCKNTADDAFSKVAVIAAVTGRIPKKKNMNFNQFWSEIKKEPWGGVEGRELHYLVVNKISGQAMIKSIFDVQTYVPNPCRIMQINWCKEFLAKDYKPEDLTEKKKELLRCVQKSIRTSIDSQLEFSRADI